MFDDKNKFPYGAHHLRALPKPNLNVLQTPIRKTRSQGPAEYEAYSPPHRIANNNRICRPLGEVPIYVEHPNSSYVSKELQSINHNLRNLAAHAEITYSPAGRNIVRAVTNTPNKREFIKTPNCDINMYVLLKDLTEKQRQQIFTNEANFDAKTQENYTPDVTTQAQLDKLAQLPQPAIKYHSVIITEKSLELAQCQPKHRTQKQIMGGISAKTHAISKGFLGEGVDVNKEGWNWEWLHLVAYRLAGPDSQKNLLINQRKGFNPQTSDNLVAGTAGCNGAMLNIETHITQLIRNQKVKKVYLTVTAFLVPNTHIAEKITYQYTYYCSLLKKDIQTTHYFKPIDSSCSIPHGGKIYRVLNTPRLSVEQHTFNPSNLDVQNDVEVPNP